MRKILSASAYGSMNVDRHAASIFAVEYIKFRPWNIIVAMLQELKSPVAPNISSMRFAELTVLTANKRSKVFG